MIGPFYPRLPSPQFRARWLAVALAEALIFADELRTLGLADKAAAVDQAVRALFAHLSEAPFPLPGFLDAASWAFQEVFGEDVAETSLGPPGRLQ